ncbi:MAG: MerR family transcriptional regulator [Anaerovoracaceae bacterium]
MYYSIGRLSELTGMNISTLRYYDQIGILVPEYRNKNTGYRYYSEEQMLKVQLIKNMKMLKFSIEDMKKVLAKKDISFLMEKVEELQYELKVQLKAVNEIRQYLEEGRNLLMEYLKEGEHVFFKRKSLERRTVPELYLLCMEAEGSFYDKSFFTRECLKIQKLRDSKDVLQAGGLMLIPGKDGEKSFINDGSCFRLCMPVCNNVNPLADPGILRFPKQTVVSSIFAGGKENLKKSLSDLHKWMDENNHKAAGSVIIECLLEPSDTMKEDLYIFRLNIPI